MSLSIGFGTLGRLEQERQHFVDMMIDHAAEVFAEARLSPKLSEFRLAEAHFAWCHDMTRVGGREPFITDGLDHFKRVGHLAFWLRRTSPIFDAEILEGYQEVEPESEEKRSFLMAYMNEYFAFDFGLQVCNLYHCHGSESGGHSPIKPTQKYIVNACNFLKFKSVSPHSMYMIYYSLFTTGIDNRK